VLLLRRNKLREVNEISGDGRTLGTDGPVGGVHLVLWGVATTPARQQSCRHARAFADRGGTGAARKEVPR